MAVQRDEEDETMIYWWEASDGEYIYMQQGEDQILMNRKVAVELAKNLLKTLDDED